MLYSLISKRRSWDFEYANAFDSIKYQMKNLRIPKMYACSDHSLTVFTRNYCIEATCDGEFVEGVSVAYQQSMCNDITPITRAKVVRKYIDE